MGIFKTEKLPVTSINGANYIIESTLNYTVQFPSNLLDATAVGDTVSILSIIWKINPIHLSTHEDLSFASPLVSIFLLDNFNKAIPISYSQVYLKFPITRTPNSLKNSLE